MATPDPVEELRRLYPPILTTAHVAEMMHCTIGDVRDKVHRGELPALRWGQQFRFTLTNACEPLYTHDVVLYLWSPGTGKWPAVTARSCTPTVSHNPLSKNFRRNAGARYHQRLATIGTH